MPNETRIHRTESAATRAEILHDRKMADRERTMERKHARAGKVATRRAFGGQL